MTRPNPHWDVPFFRSLCGPFARVWALLIPVVLTVGAQAAPGDAVANRKISEAINEHYFATNFDQAESVLIGATLACAGQCSPQVLARVWMYVGMVRVNGKNDRAGGVVAFRQALALDPGVRLDGALVTAATTPAFLEAGGGATPVAAPAAAQPAAPPAARPSQAPSPQPQPVQALQPVPGVFGCVPPPGEMPLGHPIPISCGSAKSAASGTAYYQTPDSVDWRAALLRPDSGLLRGVVPCAGVAQAGALRVYIELRDGQAQTLENLGTRAAPFEFRIVEASTKPPPSFPGQPPPPVCSPEQLAKAKPRGGTREWGDSCNEGLECRSGFCLDGSCDSCSQNSDCETDECIDGTCTRPPEDEGSLFGSTEAPKNWVGLNGALDFASVGGEDVCTRANLADNGYACFYAGKSTQYVGDPFPGSGGEVKSALALANVRFLLAYDRVISRSVTLGLRAGLATGGSPQTSNNQKFLPLHAEARVGYWLGSDPMAQAGLRPYVHAGVGVAAVHSKTTLGVHDCWGGKDRAFEQAAEDPIAYEECIAGEDSSSSTTTELDAFQRMGKLFVTAGGGMVYAFSPAFGMQFNLNLMLLFPNSGFVLEPSLGPVIGF
ncbi:hypothetical protein ACFL5O_00250 [Myxococcota bacterium]